MIRIQLHISERQDSQLRSLARKQHTARADLIRRGVELLLQQEVGDDDPLINLIGAAGPAGRSDGAEHHDDVVYSPIEETGAEPRL